MKCNFITSSGEPCGAELSSRGFYKKNGADYEKCTCANGHKRTLHECEGVIVQGRTGRRPTGIPPMVKIDARISPDTRAKLRAEFGSDTEFFNAALTAWTNGSIIVSRYPVKS